DRRLRALWERYASATVRAVIAVSDFCMTIDHVLIRAWAGRRDARPATNEGDERPWPLFFAFGPPSPGVVEIGWDRFFHEFERASLAFVYPALDEEGDELDDMHEFVQRIAVPALLRAGRATIIARLS